uniref:Uncharacterized protein n=1 Tax=uncultured prokaryote TaxID=198431 RepID=A0A0H5QQ88_9ZZZZ|nr:hypothetical protein [uncultured prokaryote]
MNQQEPSPERMGISRDLAFLSMIYDMSNDSFDEDFRSYVKEFRLHALLNPEIKEADIRHIAKEDGRQRFIIFFNGKVFDHFDFSATEKMFPGDSPADLDDIGFKPFDFTNPKKPLES